MKIKKVKGEIGTTGDYVDFKITGYPSADVYKAIEHEHYCDDSACDIHAALEAECPLTAASFLCGATETPLLDMVVWAHNFNHTLIWYLYSTDSPHDWDRWYRYHKKHGVECPSCGSFNYGNNYWTPERCGNCLHNFVVHILEG